jgi:hypothetical protein
MEFFSLEVAAIDNLLNFLGEVWSHKLVNPIGPSATNCKLKTKIILNNVTFTFFIIMHYQVDVLQLQIVIAWYLYRIYRHVITQQLISAMESPICM